MQRLFSDLPSTVSIEPTYTLIWSFPLKVSWDGGPGSIGDTGLRYVILAGIEVQQFARLDFEGLCFKASGLSAGLSLTREGPFKI